MFQYTVQITALLAITLLYAAFDVFNKRNVPDIFAYVSVIAGVIITLIYNSSALALSVGLALLIGFVSYIIYRLGLWGAGDGFELVAVSLVFPLQPQPIIGFMPQFGMPFILSVFVATGFVAVLIVPLYYLIFAKKTETRRKTGLKHLFFGVLLLALYILLFIFVYFFYNFTLSNLILMILIAVPSSITLVFEEEITARMVTDIYTTKLEEGDIIAFNMMSKRELHYFSSKYPKFERLATRSLIKTLRKEKRKLPVYKNAAPLAVFIGAGVVISLLFGNIILLVL